MVVSNPDTGSISNTGNSRFSVLDYPGYSSLIAAKILSVPWLLYQKVIKKYSRKNT